MITNPGTRAGLKGIFSRGETPTQEDFHLLIDSVLNLHDDHLTCLPNGGLKVYAGEKDGILVEFQMDRADGSTNWVLLKQNDPSGQPGISLRYKPYRLSNLQYPPPDPLFVGNQGCVGISHNDPRFALEVGGAVGMETRLGTYLEGKLPANGHWHNLLGTLESPAPRGYFALEVLAYVLPPTGSGQYGITHAICLGAHPEGNHWLVERLGFHNRRGIQQTQGYYGSKRNRVDLRWGGTREAPMLELRTRKRLRDSTVHYRVTNLLPPIPSTPTR